GMPPREVLLVDDDEYTRLFMSRFLPSPPFHVATAENGQEAVEAMADRWPDYLLVDLEMPVRNGVETVRWVREYEAEQGRPRCRVVMLSANDDDASAVRGLAAGADRYLRKPVSREALLAALRELEDRRGEQLPPAAAGSGAPEAAHAVDLPLELEPDSAAAEDVLRLPAAWIEAFPDYLQAQRKTLDDIARAVAEGDRDTVRLHAHRACGALSLVGLQWAARECRALEQGAAHESAGELERRLAGLREYLGKVRAEPA
ncbi:MAG TPA: response regulator, partial [Ramlibacter sp.]